MINDVNFGLISPLSQVQAADMGAVQRTNANLLANDALVERANLENDRIRALTPLQLEAAKDELNRNRALTPLELQSKESAVQQQQALNPIQVESAKAALTGKGLENSEQALLTNIHKSQFVADTAASILFAPADQKQQALDMAREKIKQMGGDVSQLPEKYTPEVDQLASSYLNSGMSSVERYKAMLRPGAQFTLKPGEARYDSSGKVIAESDNEDPMIKAKDFTNTQKVRKEFIGQSKEFQGINTAYNRVVASAKDPSAAGDLALIFNYMKTLDPGSTVREGEFATAQNSGSVPDTIAARYNKVIAGERLSSTQRADFVDRASKLYDAAQENQFQLEDQYKELAKKSGVNPELVVVNYSGRTEKKKADIPKSSFEMTNQYETNTGKPIPAEAIQQYAMKLGITPDEVISRKGLKKKVTRK